jgi:hypothetical protein
VPAPTPQPPPPTPKPAPATPEPPQATPEPDEPGTAVGTRGPRRAVRDFYGAVEAHDWEAAIGLWSPSMQERYPPDIWLIDRFRPTTRIDITALDTVFVDRDAGLARVAVTIVEYRTIEPSPRTFVGAWDLVRIDGRWLLDQPYF